MSKSEWAALLASLAGNDGARRDALLMLSDEDWLADGERDWIRAGATREHTLSPNRGNEWTFDSYKWAAASNVRALIPKAVGRRLRQKEVHVQDYTHPYDSHADAWLDLLDAVSGVSVTAGGLHQPR